MYIYYIKNTVNDKTYVGLSTKDKGVRIKRHKSRLKANSHHNNILQNSWNKRGEEVFDFGILEEGIETIEELNDAEEFWVLTLQSRYFQKGYNIRPAGDYTKRSKKTCRKISESKKGTHRSKEVKEKLSKAHKGKVVVKDLNGNCFQVSVNNPKYVSGELVPVNTGKTLSKTHRENIAKGNLGKTMSEETKKKMSKAHWGENVYHSKLTKEQALTIKTSKKTAEELAKNYEVAQTTIRHIWNGSQWAHLNIPEKKEKELKKFRKKKIRKNKGK